MSGKMIDEKFSNYWSKFVNLPIFSNLLGTVYSGGNLVFFHDGNVIASPVGNKVTVFDLKNHKSETLPFESQLNILVIALSPNGVNALLVNERGEAFFVNLSSKVILHRHRFNKLVKDVKFSPNGKKFAVCRDIDVQLFRSPDPKKRQFNPFYLEKVFHVAHDSTNCIDWSSDSRLFAVGSEDMQTKVCGSQNYKNLFMCPVSGHTSPVVACFFEKNSYNLMTLDRRGAVVYWECSLGASDLVLCSKEGQMESEEVGTGTDMMNYKKLSRHFFKESLDLHGSNVLLCCADFHKENRLLITGFSNGVFALHEMPEFNLIHNLSVSECSVHSVAMNRSGDWIGVGCSGRGIGQLLVWEWQSETYVMKQQGHTQNTNSLSYSPDGELLATGGEDGKVKVWTVKTGFCFVTFHEHAASVTGVAWTQGGKAVLSASLDGSVRAFDLNRYRNFRTLTSTEPVQFSCLAVDKSGEVVCAGAQDIFDVFVWSLQTGRLLEVLSGHEAPVSGVCFSPSHPVMASCSWDKTLRIWDVFEGKGGKEVMDLSAEGLDVKFTPDGVGVGVLSMDSQVTMFDWRRGEQTGSIECRLDLEVGRGELDQITASKSASSKSFTKLDFSADGGFLLIGGQSKAVCIYSVKEQLLVKKFRVTANFSLDSVADDIDRRKMTEFGNLSLIDGSDSEDEEGRRSKKIKLPGVRSGDFSQRIHRPEIRVSDVQFSPTGRAWAACSTEGVLIYSLDDSLLFDPFMLEEEITPESIRKELRKCEFGRGLLMSLKLNQSALITEALEETPVSEISAICRSMPLLYAEKMLWWLSSGALEETRHFEFYLLWAQRLMMHHGSQLKLRKAENLATLNSLQQTISRKQTELGKICEHNKYALQYIMEVRKMDQNKKTESELRAEPNSAKDEIFSDTEVTTSRQ